jgi:dihydroorotase
MPYPPPLLITGGRVLDPASKTDETADVAIVAGSIAQIGPNLTRLPAARVIDASGCLVTPGLIDPHVHLREPGHEYKETIISGSRAAVAGGFTAVCCMPNTQPAIDSPEVIRFVYDRAAGAECRVYPIAAATKGRRGVELGEVLLCAKAGAVGFSDDGDAVPTAGLMARVLGAVAATGKVFMQHCQDPTMTVGASMHAGRISTRLGLTGWPRAAEEVIIERDIRLNRSAGCRYHVQHLSSAGSVEIVRRARAEGQPVTAEASPHHLLLTDEAVDRGGSPDTMAKVNPPVREQSDIDAVRRAVSEGVITVLATDHAPHAAHEKALPFEEAPMGLVGLETALALYVQALVETGVIGWMRLVEMMTVEPARLCGLTDLGALRVGGPADITIIDPDRPWTIRATELVGPSRNTPFDGWSVRGRAVATIVAGEVKFECAR